MSFMSTFLGLFRLKRLSISNVDEIAGFLQTRSAYVAQTSLFGYLKTRMGTQFRIYFEDEVFAAEISQATGHIFLSCLADLTVFAVTTAGDQDRLTAPQAAALARYCFPKAVNKTEDDRIIKLSTGAIEQFKQRLSTTDWLPTTPAQRMFFQSEEALVRFAPVIDEFKQQDRHILVNSIRFRWHNIRCQLKKALHSEALCEDWMNLNGSPSGFEK